MVMPDSARLSPVTGGSIVGLQRDAVRVEDQNPYELDIRRLVRSRSGRCGFGRRWFVGDPEKMTDLPDHAPHGSDVRQPGYATDLVQLQTNQRLPLVSPAADRTADLLYLYVPHRKLPRTQAAYGNAEGREGKGQSRLANPATGHPVALKCDGQPQLVHLA
jgi:hypothetical protein